MPGQGRGRGRPVPETTRLGRMINKRGIKIYTLCGKTDIYARLMTEYTNGRRIITAEHAARLAKALDCTPADIIEPNLTVDLTDRTGQPIDKSNGNSVKGMPLPHLEPIPTPPPKNAHVPTVAPERLIRKAV